MKSAYFVRFGDNPRSDFKRGYSYPMGEFGITSAMHEGLSGYDIETVGNLPDTVLALYKRYYPVDTRFALFRGQRVGTGPDNEPLFAPLALIAHVKTPLRPSSAAFDANSVSQRLVRAALRVDPTLLDVLLPAEDFTDDLRARELKRAQRSRR